MNFPRTSAHKGRGTVILSLRAHHVFCHCERSVAIPYPHQEIASADFFSLATTEGKSLLRLRLVTASLLAMTERGRALSGREDGYSRLVGAGFSGGGCMGNYISYVRFGKLEVAPGDSQDLWLFLFGNIGVVELEALHLAPDVSAVAFVEID